MEVLYSRYVEIFGSNLMGIHGKGHALHAKKHKGALQGVSEGRSGMSYAIPTKVSPYKNEHVSYQTLTDSLRLFNVYASLNPGERFIGSHLGCGHAGMDEDRVIQCIIDAGGVPQNVRWPNSWMAIISPERFYNSILIAGSRTITNLSSDNKKIIIDRITEASEYGHVSIVSGMAKGPDRWGIDVAKELGLYLIECPAEWDVFGKSAGMVRNRLMSLITSEALIFYDGVSSGTKNMISLLGSENITTTIIE